VSISRRTTARGEIRYDVRARVAGRVVTKTFKRRREAEAYVVRLEAARLDGVLIDPRRRRTPFSEVADEWVAAGINKRITSVARDRSIVSKHLKPAFGERPVGAITPAEVQAAVDRWSQRQVPSTVGRQFSCLRAIFTYAEAVDLVLRSPCRGVRRPKVRLVDRPELTPEELSQLARVLGPEQGAFMWCGAVLGLRWSETAGLTVTRIDAHGRTVTVDRQLARSGVLVVPKTLASIRTLSCPNWLIGQLAVPASSSHASGGSGDGLVFRNTDGGPLSYTNWRTRTWQPACELAGLPGLRYHDLRSLAATVLVAAGVDIKTAQVRLGHASPQVTLGIYARATRAADRRAADLVGEVFRPRDRRAIEFPAGPKTQQRSPTTRTFEWRRRCLIQTRVSCWNG
jgi:integrase